MGKAVLHHAYIKEGERLPEDLSWERVRHVATRDEGNGLDIWWFAIPDEDE